MHQARLIVNGDDFGKSPEVNNAIIRAFRAGTLTSCSLMAAGDAFDHAVLLARENDGLAVGIHLVTVQGRAVLPHSEIPAIVDREGRFPDSPVAAGLKYYFSTAARRQLARELSAQFQKFHATGLKLSHVDSHLHMHVHPVVFAVSLGLAEQYEVRRMRLPRDDFRLAVRFRKEHLAARAITTLVFELLSRRMKRVLLERGFSFPERAYGHLYSGRMTIEYVLFVLDHLRTGNHEIYFHPADLGGVPASGPEQHQCAKELDILLSRDFMNRLLDPGIDLTSYFELTAGE
jgi:hopanoid biosynthesis associated protein HpnK